MPYAPNSLDSREFSVTLCHTTDSVPICHSCVFSSPVVPSTSVRRFRIQTNVSEFKRGNILSKRNDSPDLSFERDCVADLITVSGFVNFSIYSIAQQDINSMDSIQDSILVEFLTRKGLFVVLSPSPGAYAHINS